MKRKILKNWLTVALQNYDKLYALKDKDFSDTSKMQEMEQWLTDNLAYSKPNRHLRRQLDAVITAITNDMELAEIGDNYQLADECMIIMMARSNHLGSVRKTANISFEVLTYGHTTGYLQGGTSVIEKAMSSILNKVFGGELDAVYS